MFSELACMYWNYNYGCTVPDLHVFHWVLRVWGMYVTITAGEMLALLHVLVAQAVGYRTGCPAGFVPINLFICLQLVSNRT